MSGNELRSVPEDGLIPVPAPPAKEAYSTVQSPSTVYQSMANTYTPYTPHAEPTTAQEKERIPRKAHYIIIGLSVLLAATVIGGAAGGSIAVHNAKK